MIFFQKGPQIDNMLTLVQKQTRPSLLTIGASLGLDRLVMDFCHPSTRFYLKKNTPRQSLRFLLMSMEEILCVSLYIYIYIYIYPFKRLWRIVGVYSTKAMYPLSSVKNS